ncbi:iron-hydroxamate ABC transporter substrate-binding protein [Alkalihalobacillus trypoxylicola]|uniref:ABC transporter substrate-binding protein n=1 Tax=Alkalihalobacillus trypoxylicola TaxID=519424 RepID=A0A161QEH5_9BACI|nr:iron-hydroxamate ABC transporter substrate-binding protein [Alkalihalobacillus trypoxylicola]KYG26937.1 ABC transporter substrate-binding protein [Alkalihalobacillus trypoxylicola]
MKKYMLLIVLLLALIASGCNTSENDAQEGEAPEETGSSETFTYESENGPIEVPTNPERVIVLSSFAGNVMALDVPLVGVDSWSKINPRYDEYLQGVEEVTDESLEKILELEPDLIIGLSNIKNVDKLNQIAPTVTYTYGNLDYLTQHIEIGKLLNKEEEAQSWVDDFQQRAQEAGREIKEKIGEDATVSVFETFDKQMYVFGDNFARGTEILYQEMELNMPEKVQEVALADGYFALSNEVIGDYAGDYMVISTDGSDNSYQETESYQNIPAVQNGQVFEADAKEFYFNDPLTLELQLEFFKEKFLE